MRLHLLGVNGPYPASGGATSGYFLEAGEKYLQFDFGAGVLARLTEIFPPEELDALFLSHWHFDHTSDLLPLIYRLQAAGRALPVYGPADEASALQKIVAEADCFQLRTVAPGDELALGGVRVQVGSARHPVPGVGYRVTAEEKTLGYTGDTKTLPGLAEFYRGCDLLLADGLFPQADWGEAKPHLSARLAAELAREAGAKELILTHLNPVYAPELLLKEAREVFPGVKIAQRGQVYAL